MNRKLLILIALFIPAALAQTVTVDDGDPEYNDTGWTLAVGQGFNNDVRFVAAGTGQQATWVPNLSSGTYAVYASWTVHLNRATDAKYIVNHVSGSSIFLRNQELLANGSNGSSGEWSNWSFLGSFAFLSGTSGNVSLNNTADEYVIADAIRFVKIAGTTLFVNSSCAGFAAPCFTSLQAAIVNATDGDTILVSPGLYNETIMACPTPFSDQGMFCVDKSIRIIGDPNGPGVGCSPGAPVIDGGGAFASAFVISDTSNVFISGFEIKNFANPGCCTGGIGNAVLAWNANTTNVTIQDNCMHDLGWNGVLVGSDDGSVQSGWIVRKNVITNVSENGIELTNTANSQILFNVINGPSAITPWDITDAGVGIEVAARAFDYAGPTNITSFGISVIGNKINGPFAPLSRAGINIMSRSYCATCPAVLTGVNVMHNTINGTGTRGVYIVSHSRAGGPAYLSNVRVIDNLLTLNSVGADLGVAEGAFGASSVDGVYQNIEISDNTVTKNSIGMRNGINTLMLRNKIYNNTIGIFLNNTATNTSVRKNFIYNNSDGVVVDGDDNHVTDNRIETNNGTTGVHVNATASNTRVVRNFFISNAPQAFDAGTNTKWNDTVNGNCWSDLRLNPGFPHTYFINIINATHNATDYRPCGVNAMLTSVGKGGGLISIQDFTKFKKNTTLVTALLKEKNGLLSGLVRITVRATSNESKDIYANIKSYPDTIESFGPSLVKVSGTGALNKVVRLKGKIIEEEDHNVNLTIWINKTHTSVVAYAGPFLELNITNARTSTFRFKEQK